LARACTLAPIQGYHPTTHREDPGLTAMEDRRYAVVLAV
jgi:hypothetical protein